jgi:hypothetical protein
MTLPLVQVVCLILNTRRTLFEIIKDGQLCIFSAALAAISIYDISKHTFEPSKAVTAGVVAIFLLSLGALIISLIWATAFYGVSIVVNCSTHRLSNPGAAPVNLLGWISLSMLAGTIAFVLAFRYLLDAF